MSKNNESVNVSFSSTEDGELICHLIYKGESIAMFTEDELLELNKNVESVNGDIVKFTVGYNDGFPSYRLNDNDHNHIYNIYVEKTFNIPKDELVLKLNIL